MEHEPLSSPSPDVSEQEVDNDGNSLHGISYPLDVSLSSAHSSPLPARSTTTNVAPSTSAKKKYKMDKADEVLMTINEYCKKPNEQNVEDKHDVFGKNVAHKLRGLNNMRRLLVEKIINDALFEAEMGTLTHHHKLVPLAVTNTQFPKQHNGFLQSSPMSGPPAHTTPKLPSLSSTMDPLAEAVYVKNEIPQWLYHR